MQEGSKYQTTSQAITAVDVNSYLPQNRTRKSTTEKERIENWFITPLQKLDGDDAIICLMIVFPLLEKILRSETNVANEQKLDTGETSKAMKVLSKYLGISEKDTRIFWDCFRNGLMHRAMVKSVIKYELKPDKTDGKSVKIENEKVIVYVWRLKKMTIDLLEKHGKKLWKDSAFPLPEVF